MTVKISDLIAKAQERKQVKIHELQVKSLDGTVKVQAPDRALCLDAMDMGHDGDLYVIYECMVEPSLKDKALQEACGCTTPVDVVQAVFSPGEIAQLSAKLIELAGYGDGVVTEVKN